MTSGGQSKRGVTISDGMIRNVTRALLLDAEFYKEVAATTTLIVQAAVVVVIANMLAGIGAAFATESNALAGAGIGIVTGLVGWLVWSGFAYAVGVRLFGGHSSYREMLRVIGFSYAPLAIGIVPWLGFVGAAWALFAAVVAIRESMVFSTKRSIAVTSVGWAAWLVLAVVLNALLGLDFFTAWPV